MLGEIAGTRKKWDAGTPPQVLPLPLTIGDPTCVSGGENFAEIDPDRPLIDGFETGCFARPLVPGLTMERCGDWEFSLELLRRLYNGDLAGVEAWVLGRFPSASVTSILSAAGPRPSRTILAAADWSAVFFAGTENYEQLALQALSIVEGPQQYYSYSTLSFWELQANDVGTDLAGLGVDPTKPISLWGHSYGGVIASIIGAKILSNLGRPSQLQLVTFGSPQPGDDRMQNILGRIPSRHFINDADPVPFLPPGATDWLLLGGPIGARLRRLWGEWRHPYPTVNVAYDGTQRAGPDANTAYFLIADSIARAIIGVPQPVFTAHTLAEYQRRVRCGVAPVTVVNSVSCPDGSIIVSPNTGDVLEILNTGNFNLWTAGAAFLQPAAAIAGVYVEAFNGATAPALLVNGGNFESDFLFGVNTGHGGADRFCLVVGSEQIVLTGAVTIGSAGPDRGYALKVDFKHRESGLLVQRALKVSPPGAMFLVEEVGMGVYLGVDGDGNIVTDNVDAAHAPPGGTPGRLALYDSGGTLVGYVPVYAGAAPPITPDLWLTTLAGCYQDSAATVPCTTNSDPIGAMVSQGSTPNVARQITTDAQGIYRTGALNGLPGCEYKSPSPPLVTHFDLDNPVALHGEFSLYAVIQQSQNETNILGGGPAGQGSLGWHGANFWFVNDAVGVLTTAAANQLGDVLVRVRRDAANNLFIQTTGNAEVNAGVLAGTITIGEILARSISNWESVAGDAFEDIRLFVGSVSPSDDAVILTDINSLWAVTL